MCIRDSYYDNLFGILPAFFCTEIPYAPRIVATAVKGDFTRAKEARQRSDGHGEDVVPSSVVPHLTALNPVYTSKTTS